MIRKKYRIVQFYKTADGRKPVAEWLNTLDDERAQAVAMGVRFFEEYPNPVVPKKFFEKVTDHIWEIKVHYGKEQYRLLSFIENDAIIIAVQGIAKKSMDLKSRTSNWPKNAEKFTLNKNSFRRKNHHERHRKIYQ